MHFNQTSAAIQVSDTICEAYSTLFLKDFSLQMLEESLARGPDITAIDMNIFEHFYQGLKVNRLELKGDFDDLAGWLLVHIEAYIDAQEPDTPFDLTDWERLTPEQRADVTRDAERLSPMLDIALTEACHASRMREFYKDFEPVPVDPGGRIRDLHVSMVQAVLQLRGRSR